MMKVNELALIEYEKRIRNVKKELSDKEKELHEKDMEVKSIEQKQTKLESNKFFVEKNYDGLKVSIHRKEQEVVVFFNEIDITSKIPMIKERVLSLANADFVLDAFFVPIKDELRGNELAIKFLEDNEMELDFYCFYVFDCPYYGRSLEQYSLYDRKKILHSLNYNDVVLESGSIEVSSFDETSKTIELFENVIDSNGVLMRKTDSVYYLEDDGNSFLELYAVPFGSEQVEKD